jgi:hypothetical protein
MATRGLGAVEATVADWPRSWRLGKSSAKRNNRPSIRLFRTALCLVAKRPGVQNVRETRRTEMNSL